MMRLAALSLEHCLPTVSGEARVAEQRFESPKTKSVQIYGSLGGRGPQAEPN